MKSVFKIILIIISFVLFSCNGLVEEEIQKCYLRIDSPQCRTILPENLTFSSLENFVLKGTPLGQSEITFRSWNSYDDMILESSLLCDAGYWNFTLTANYKGKLAYTASIQNILVTAGINTLSFNFEEVVSTTGECEVRLFFPNDVQVKGVKAGLFSVKDNTPVEGFELSVMEIVLDDSNKYYIDYKKENVPSGEYFFKAYFYRNGECSELIQAPYVELLKISSASKSSAVREISDFEHMYTITYELNGGEWKDGFVPITSFNEYENVSLPSVENVSKKNCVFYGWYTKPDDYENSKLEGWTNGTQNSSRTVYAKWKYDINKLPEVIATCADEGEYTFEVCGDCIIYRYKVTDELKKFSFAKFSIDLSDVDNCFDLYFSDCSSLASVVIPEGVTTIGDYAFSGCSSLAIVNIPEGVTTIGNSAFSHCSSLASVNIPEGVTTIGNSAFYDCSSLASVNIPEGVTSIGDSAFSRCSSLASVVIPEGVTTIGNSAFYGCSSLASVNISEGVTTIGNSAFDRCMRLTGVTIPGSVTTIGEDAFNDCKNLCEIRYGGSLSNWCAIPNHAIDTDQGVKYYFNGMLIENSVKVEGIDRIGAYAFYGSKELEYVDIYESVTEIGKFAFYKSNLKGDIVLPSTLEKIGTHALWGINFDSLTLLSRIPPVIEYNYSSDTQLGYPKKIYVPKGCAEAYKTAPGYTGYASKIFELEE